MPFWSDSNIEPKRKNRWLLYIQDFEPWMMVSFTKPSITIGKSTYQEINNIRHKPTIARWEPCNFTITDLETEDKDNSFLNTTAGFMSIIRGSGYPTLEEPKLPKRDKNGIIETFSTEDPTDYYEKGGEVFSNIMKDKAMKALGRVRFVQLSVGSKNKEEPIEEWVLHNCWLERCDFGGDMTYDDDIVKISATICYDYATYRRIRKAV
jgi:hypothetical protein